MIFCGQPIGNAPSLFLKYDQGAYQSATASCKPMMAMGRRAGDICGYCKRSWSTDSCKCEEVKGLRTESLSSLLSNPIEFPHENKRHTCVFVYLPYQRWPGVEAADPAQFSEACMPPWEGWYAAWLDPQLVDVGRTRPTWSEVDVIMTKVHFFDGTYLDGYMDSSGQLIVTIPGPRPPRGRDYDELRNLIRVRAEVTQALTWKEITSGSRGTVHSGTRVPNGGRRAWYVVKPSEDNDEEYVIRMLPDDEDDEGKFETVSIAAIRNIAPYLHYEFQRRIKRRFKRLVGADVQFFMRQLFNRAKENDAAVRYALKRSWLDAVPSLSSTLQSIGEQRDLFLTAFARAKAKARVEEEMKNGAQVAQSNRGNGTSEGGANAITKSEENKAHEKPVVLPGE